MSGIRVAVGVSVAVGVMVAVDVAVADGVTVAVKVVVGVRVGGANKGAPQIARLTSKRSMNPAYVPRREIDGDFRSPTDESYS
jgi:hypothetical protein